MSPQVGAITALLQQEETAAETSTTTDVDVVCSNGGAVCEVLYEWTDSELFAEATSFHPLSLPCALAIGWLAIGSPGRASLFRVSSAVKQRAVSLGLLVVVALYCVRLAGGTLPD